MKGGTVYQFGIETSTFVNRQVPKCLAPLRGVNTEALDGNALQCQLIAPLRGANNFGTGGNSSCIRTDFFLLANSSIKRIHRLFPIIKLL